MTVEDVANGIVPIDGRLKPLLVNLRSRDHDELSEYGISLADAERMLEMPAALGALFVRDRQPVSVVAFHRLTPRALSASMLATNDWPDVAIKVVRWGLKVAKPALLEAGYVRAECRTMQGHFDAITLLEGLGFKLECVVRSFGATGRDFLQYAWRLDDHVPDTKSAKG